MRVKGVTCPECAMHRRQQFVATLQLRAKPDDIKTMLNVVNKFETYVLKTEDSPNGVDIYFTNKEAAKHIASELRQKFEMWTKVSGQAYSWDKQKNRPRYKLVILLRVKENVQK